MFRNFSIFFLKKMSLVGVLATHSLKNGEDRGVFVDYICTKKSCRRRGVARRLLESLGSNHIWLVVHSFTPAFRAYLKLGFVTVATVAHYESSALETCMHRTRPSQRDVCKLGTKKASMTTEEWNGIVDFVRNNSNLSTSGAICLLGGYDSDVEYRWLCESEL